jgi:hypothetical protein
LKGCGNVIECAVRFRVGWPDRFFDYDSFTATQISWASNIESSLIDEMKSSEAFWQNVLVKDIAIKNWADQQT